MPGKAIDAKGVEHTLPDAERDLVVHDASGISRRIVAGQPVPFDLLEAYREETGTTDVGDGSTAEVIYANRSVEDLQKDLASRGLTVEGSGAQGKVLKADLIDALEADDVA